MALTTPRNIGEQVTGPPVGGTRPTTTPAPRPRGAGRGRTARQAGISRPTAPRPVGAAPRQPRAGGTPGGVGLVRIPQRPAGRPTGGRPTGQARVPTAVPRRVPRPANIIQTRPPTLRENIQRRGSTLEQAGQFLEEAQRRRNRIRGR